MKGACPIYAQPKIKASFDTYLHKKMLYTNYKTDIYGLGQFYRGALP